MSKALLVILGLVVCSLAVTPFDTVKELVNKDECGLQGMETIRPRLQNKLEQVRANPSDFAAKAELLAMIEDVKSIYESCGINNKVQPALGDAVEAAGISFLLASNCFKDVGAVLLIADEIIQDPSNIAEDAIILIFVYILGSQCISDGQQFINFILGFVN